jgi:hypothetical protein
MVGAPLVVCRQHPEDEPIWHRADRPCPVCRERERIAELQQLVKELTMRK